MEILYLTTERAKKKNKQEVIITGYSNSKLKGTSGVWFLCKLFFYHP